MTKFDGEVWICGVQSSIEMKSGGGGGGNTTTVQKADPWSGQQPHLQNIFGQAQNLSQNPTQFFPGQTFAGLSPETETALQMQTNRAISGSPVMNSMNAELTKTLGGDYLSAGNPHFSAMMDQVGNQVQNQMDSRFAASGRFGSGAHAAATAGALADQAGRLGYQNYADERTNQMRGMLFAPQAAQSDYYDLAKLGEVGGIREDLTQQQINENMQRFNFNQMEPWQRLGLYNSMIQGNYGGESTSTVNTPRRSMAAGAVGGGLSGAATGAMLGSVVPGIGTGFGALAGGGLGLLGGLL